MEFILWVLVVALTVFGILNLFGGHIIFGLILLVLAFMLGGGNFSMRR